MSKRKRVIQRKARTHTSVVPYHVRTDSGINVDVTTLVYRGELQRAARRVTLAPVTYPSLADILAVVQRELAVERERARYTLPPQLRPSAPVVTGHEPVAAPYKPREISTDSAGYVPKASWTRAELLRDILLAARSA